MVTLELARGIPRGPSWKFWLFATAWCVVAWVFAATMFWATLRTFDRCLGRMPETSVPEDGDHQSDSMVHHRPIRSSCRHPPRIASPCRSG